MKIIECLQIKERREIWPQRARNWRQVKLYLESARGSPGRAWNKTLHTSDIIRCNLLPLIYIFVDLHYFYPMVNSSLILILIFFCFFPPAVYPHPELIPLSLWTIYIPFWSCVSALAFCEGKAITHMQLAKLSTYEFIGSEHRPLAMIQFTSFPRDFEPLETHMIFTIMSIRYVRLNELSNIATGIRNFGYTINLGKKISFQKKNVF